MMSQPMRTPAGPPVRRAEPEPMKRPVPMEPAEKLKSVCGLVKVDQETHLRQRSSEDDGASSFAEAWENP